MAYEFELDGDIGEPFRDALGTWIVEFALGFDTDEDLGILMSVMLVPGGSYLDPPVEGIVDLRFGIRERDLTSDWKVGPPDYSRETVDKYIPKDARGPVLTFILLAVSELIKEAKPSGITMETYYPNLDAKGLEKYAAISSILKLGGYKEADRFRDETTGKDYWFFDRSS
jgi:hypothetical protein